eukprot:5846900-Alexandrium_andersonii.AAC.1
MTTAVKESHERLESSVFIKSAIPCLLPVGCTLVSKVISVSVALSVDMSDPRASGPPRNGPVILPTIVKPPSGIVLEGQVKSCLLYTSDAADDM